MKNREIEELLNELKDEDNYIEEYGYSYKRISLGDCWLLLSYIEQLQNNRDKAIEFLKTEHMTYDSAWKWRQALINILKGDSDE